MTAKKPISNPENYLKRHPSQNQKDFHGGTKDPHCDLSPSGRNFHCRTLPKHAIQESTFYKWNKEFIEAGKKQLSGDTVRQATSEEVSQLREENRMVKETVADLVIRYDIVKKVWKFWNNRKIQKVYEVVT